MFFVSVLLSLILCKRRGHTHSISYYMREYEQNCPKARNPVFGFRILEAIKYLKPMAVEGSEDLVRIGMPDDGGYFMLDDFSNISCAYSFGIGTDWSWDVAISEKGIPVFMFDPFNAAFLKSSNLLKNTRLKFYDKGITGESKQPVLNSGLFSPERKLYTLETLLKFDENFDKTNMLLKLDVEGWEWNVLPNISSSTLSKFVQIVVELHWFEKMVRSDENFSSLLRSLQTLNKTHQLVWVNGHNGCDYCVLGGVPFPHAIEATFVRRDRKVVFKDYEKRKRRPDARNIKQRGELLLWWIHVGEDTDVETLQRPYI